VASRRPFPAPARSTADLSGYAGRVQVDSTPVPAVVGWQPSRCSAPSRDSGRRILRSPGSGRWTRRV